MERVNKGWNPETGMPGLEVCEGEWRHSEGGKIFTRDASACTIVAVHDYENGLGYMGHFPFYHEERWRLLEGMLEYVSRRNPDMNNQYVWVTGATTLDDGFYNELAEYDRNQYVEKIKEWGIPPDNIAENWLDHNEEIVELALNCDTGELSIEKRKL